MVTVASEMERQGFDIPLMIGGADDLKGAYGGEDRSQLSPGPDRLCHRCVSRAVGVASSLLQQGRRRKLCRRHPRRI